jgi:hypothetical protein
MLVKLIFAAFSLISDILNMVWPRKACHLSIERCYLFAEEQLQQWKEEDRSTSFVFDQLARLLQATENGGG